MLTTCKDCNREVSNRAHHCVHCGRPWPGAKCMPNVIAGAILATIILVGITAFVMAKREDCKRLKAVPTSFEKPR